MSKALEDFYHNERILEFSEGNFTDEKWEAALETPHKITFNHEVNFVGLHKKWTSHHHQHHDTQKYFTMFRAGKNPTAILISEQPISKQDAMFIITAWCKEMKGIG